MKAIMIVGEYLLGFLILLITLVTMLVGLIISLTEVPRYLKIKSK